MNYLTIVLYWRLYALCMVSLTISSKKNTKEKYLGGRFMYAHRAICWFVPCLVQMWTLANTTVSYILDANFGTWWSLTLRPKSFRSICRDLSSTGAIHLPLKFLKRKKKKERKSWTLDPFFSSLTNDKPGVSFTFQMRWFSVIFLQLTCRQRQRTAVNKEEWYDTHKRLLMVIKLRKSWLTIILTFPSLISYFD